MRLYVWMYAWRLAEGENSFISRYNFIYFSFISSSSLSSYPFLDFKFSLFKLENVSKRGLNKSKWHAMMPVWLKLVFNELITTVLLRITIIVIWHSRIAYNIQKIKYFSIDFRIAHNIRKIKYFSIFG